MPLVGTRLGEDLDAAIAQLVVFRREGILIDANLTNRRLGRNLAAGETIDVNLAAVGADRRTGKSLQVGGQIVRIVGQGIEVFALQYDLRGIAVIGNVERARGPALIGYVQVLLLDQDGKCNIGFLRLTCSNSDTFDLVSGEAFRLRLERIASNGEIAKLIGSILAGLGAEHGSRGSCELHVGAHYGCSRRISHHSAQGPVGGLRVGGKRRQNNRKDAQAKHESTGRRQRHTLPAKLT